VPHTAEPEIQIDDSCPFCQGHGVPFAVQLTSSSRIVSMECPICYDTWKRVTRRPGCETSPRDSR
jgi:hypothetical protein